MRFWRHSGSAPPFARLSVEHRLTAADFISLVAKWAADRPDGIPETPPGKGELEKWIRGQLYRDGQDVTWTWSDGAEEEETEEFMEWARTVVARHWPALTD